MKEVKSKDKWLSLIPDIAKKKPHKTKDNRQMKKWPEESLSYKEEQEDRGDIYLNEQ